MNIYSIIGLLMAIFVLIAGLFLASDNISMFVDYPSLFIVLGGTLAASAISVQLDRIFVLFKVFIHRVIFGKSCKFEDVIKELVQLGDAYRNGEKLDNLIAKTNDFFLKEFLVMMNEGIFTAEETLHIMGERSEEILSQHMEESNKMKIVAKFPPAFGMMGTVIGMIVLLANLGGEDAIKKVGPAMGVCLITTLYGVVVANLALIPISENLVGGSKEVYQKNRIIIEGMKLVMKKASPIMIAEMLNSYLPPRKRVNWKDLVNG